MILIPALGCDERLYEPIAGALAGRVAPQTLKVSDDTLQACVAKVLDRVAGDFIILGTSFGGRVALEVALASPKRVKGLVVIGSGAGPVADPVAGLRRSARLRAGELEQVAAEMGAIIAHMPGPNGPAARQAFIAMMRTQGAEFVARQSDGLAQRSDLWPRLHEISCPALLLWGKHDQFSPAADGQRMASLIAGGRYVELAHCGHFPTLEYPGETAAALLQWMEDADLVQRRSGLE
jgi:pimeloyl-ACP methyl ester carboxylesterase